jgi:hypothetical protein
MKKTLIPEASFYQAGDIVELINTKNFNIGMSDHYLSYGKCNGKGGGFANQKFRVSSTDKDTIYFHGGSYAGASSIMLVKRETPSRLSIILNSIKKLWNKTKH